MRAIDAIIGAFLVGLAVLIVPGWFHPKPAIRSTTDTVVQPWLEAMRKGGDGFEYWGTTGSWPRVAFFAVSDYEIVDRSHGTYKVRIHSSTRDGSPIVKIYEVLATNDGIHRVTAQGDDPNAEIHETIKRLQKAVEERQAPTEVQEAVRMRQLLMGRLQQQ